MTKLCHTCHNGGYCTITAKRQLVQLALICPIRTQSFKIYAIFSGHFQLLNKEVLTPAGCKISSTRQCQSDYVTSPNHAYLKKTLGPLQLTLTNRAPMRDRGWKIRVSGNHYCACAEPILHLYFFAIFMVPSINNKMAASDESKYYKV